MTAAVEKNFLRTWIEVDQKALENNYRLFRSIVPHSCRIMAVAKSNAYGHGLYDYAPLMERIGVDWLGVDSIVEAITLRNIGIQKPILVLGYTLPARFQDAVRHNVGLTISTFECLEALQAFRGGGRIRIHIKIDTGLHRQGFLPDQIRRIVDLLKSNPPHIEVESIYTHFAAAKNPRDRRYTQRQIQLFLRAQEVFSEAGFNPLRHVCATGGVFLHPEAHLDMVRIGIGLFGLWPSLEMKELLEKQHFLMPALAWRTVISEVKDLPAGSGISYDVTETLSRDSRVAVCPIGYWHGFPRSLSCGGEVLVRGRRAKVLGAVTMDMIVIDLTAAPDASVGDIVTLIGRDGGDEIEAYEMAQKAGGSYYEILTRLNPLIQKYYLR